MNHLPEIVLDDRRFQELVSEARMRHRPELSRVDRAQRLRSRDHADRAVRMDDGHAHLSPQPRPRQAARRAARAARSPAPRTDGRTDADPLPARRARRAAGRDHRRRRPRSGRCATAADDSIVFQVSETFVISPLMPSAYVVGRSGKFKSIAVADGAARPQGPDRLPFASPPEVGDALYLGFDEDISDLLMRVEIDASIARGAGVDPDDPPLRWEVSDGSDGWHEAEVLEDRTGGFNYGAGIVELQCPPQSGVAFAGGPSSALAALHDLRSNPRRQRGDLHPPARDLLDRRAADRRAGRRRALRPANAPRHSGRATARPGQVLPLRFSPVLPLADAERLEVRDPGSDRWLQWTEVESFAASDARRPALQARSHQRPARAGAGGAPARRRLDPVRRDPPAGSRPADERLPPRRRAPRKRRAPTR